jgi:hypothetical protein
VEDARSRRNERDEYQRRNLERSKSFSSTTFRHAAMLRHRFGAREDRLIVTPDALGGELVQQTFSVPG